MSSLLLVPFGSPGHTAPMGVIGTALRARGHQVTVFCADAHAPGLPGTGLPVAAPTRWRQGGAVPGELIAANDAAALFRYIFLGSVADMTRDIRDAALACGAELIVGDVFMPGAGLAAQLLGLPWISLSCSPFPALDAYRVFLDGPPAASFDAAPVLAELGLPAADGDNLLGRISPLRHLIPTTRRFAGPAELPGQARLVGPFTPIAHHAAPTAPGSTPTIAVTASSVSPMSLGGRAFAQDRYLRTAADALAGLDVQVVITVPAGPGPREHRPASGNVRYTAAVSHDELFDRCAMVVCHAGWGTVCRALMRDLPLVLVPIAGDEEYIARRCSELGVGIALDAATMSAAELHDAVRSVLAEPGLRAAASELGTEFRETAARETCATTIESAVAGMVE